jgi:hypothetical protein
MSELRSWACIAIVSKALFELAFIPPAHASLQPVWRATFSQGELKVHSNWGMRHVSREMLPMCPVPFITTYSASSTIRGVLVAPSTPYLWLLTFPSDLTSTTARMAGPFPAVQLATETFTDGRRTIRALSDSDFQFGRYDDVDFYDPEGALRNSHGKTQIPFGYNPFAFPTSPAGSELECTPRFNGPLRRKDVEPMFWASPSHRRIVLQTCGGGVHLIEKSSNRILMSMALPATHYLANVVFSRDEDRVALAINHADEERHIGTLMGFEILDRSLNEYMYEVFQGFVGDIYFSSDGGTIGAATTMPESFWVLRNDPISGQVERIQELEDARVLSRACQFRDEPKIFAVKDQSVRSYSLNEDGLHLELEVQYRRVDLAGEFELIRRIAPRCEGLVIQSGSSNILQSPRGEAT